jgi:hypothetical protein
MNKIKGQDSPCHGIEEEVEFHHQVKVLTIKVDVKLILTPKKLAIFHYNLLPTETPTPPQTSISTRRDHPPSPASR